MKAWLKQLAGALLVVVLALGIGGFVLLLRAQQSGLASSMAAADIRSVSPPDGSTGIPVTGDIRAEYFQHPSQDPAIKLEPTAGVTLSGGHWEGSTYVIHYSGLRENGLYHVELDQDQPGQKGEHKQIMVRWSFRTVSGATPPTTTPSPKPSSLTTPTSTANSLPDLIWYSAADGIHAVDWNGRSVRKTTPYGNDIQSPDGLKLYDSETPSTQVFDADGNQVGSVMQLFPMMWADDSDHFCGMRGTKLLIMSLDGSYQSLGPILLQGAPSQQFTPELAACSALTGRAVLVGGANGYIWSVAVVSLTDGTVIYQRRYPNPLVRVVASHDGRYIAEQLAGSATSKPYTLIRELPSGNQVGQLAGVVVSGFSWDSSLIAAGTGTPAQLTGAEVLRWQSNQVIWNKCSCPVPTAVHMLAQPFGSKLAMVATDNRGLGRLTIIDGNGSAQSVPPGTAPGQPLF